MVAFNCILFVLYGALGYRSFQKGDSAFCVYWALWSALTLYWATTI